MSNRLTFSLASLIVLLTFGLVFGTTSVMAHDDPGQNPLQADDSDPGTHDHSNSDGSQDAIVDNTTTTAVDEGVPAHNSHPMVDSIVLKPDPLTVRDNMAVVTSAAATFTLVITFDQPVVSEATLTTVALDTAEGHLGGDTTAVADAAAGAETGEFTIRITNEDGSPNADARILIGDSTRVEDTDNQFEVVVTLSDHVPATAPAVFPTGTTGDAALLFRVQVNVNAVYSLETSSTATFVNITGSGSTASAVYPFTLVNALGALPTAPGAPMNLTATSNHERGTITLNWDAPTETGGTTATPATITGYTVTKNYMMADSTAADPVTKETTDTTLTIPGSSDPALPENVEFTFTVTATNSDDLESPASDPATAMIDTMPPTVTIGDPDVDETAGTVSFTITVSEMLADGADALELNDLTITGDDSTMRNLSDPVKRTDTDGNEVYDYTLTVTPDENMSVTVTLTGDIRDLANNMADVTTTPITATYDVTPPVLDEEAVTIEPILDDDDEVTDQLLVTLVFNEDVETDRRNGGIDIDGHRGSDVTQRGNAVAVDGEDHTYEVTVDAPDHATSEHTYMTLEAGLADLAGNLTQDDIPLTYMPPEVDAPTVAITAAPDPLNCDMGSTITFAITGTDETLVIGDITISDGWVVSTTDNDPSDGTIDIVPDGNNAIGVTTVDVSVAANAVGSNAATSEPFTVGPVIEIPGNSYVLVIHPAHEDTTHLLDPYVLGSIPIRAPEVLIQHWDCMPDLTVFFGRSAPAIGGGAIVIKEADGPMGHDPGDTLADIAVGSVGLSEIMWGSDEGIQHGGAVDPNTGRRSRTNYDQTREQWIELHNRNSTAVKVTLFSRPTNEALTTEDDELDRVSNYNINNVWDPKGQSGNSEFGIDFVSMQRGKHDNAGLAPNTAKGYAEGNWNGIHANRWTVSTFSYLTARAGLWQTLAAENQNYDYFGTPGRDNKPSASTPILRTNVPSNTIVINEVSNRRDQTLEWIELKNVSDAKVNLRKYEITLVTAQGNDNSHEFYQFPDNDDIQLEAGELLLLLDTSPRDNDAHPIAVGHDRNGGNDQALGLGQNQDPKALLVSYKVANFREGGLPDDGNFILLLRNAHDKTDAGDAHVIDVVGWGDKLADASIHTQLWPLKVFGAPDARNKLEVETVHRRQHHLDPDQTAHGDKKDEHMALGNAGYTGVGYKRHAQRIAAHGGTPGYEDTRKNLVADITATGVLTISEIMYAQGDGEYPQWIEIYNSSATQSVNLHSEAGWRLVIENFDDGEIPIETLSGTLNFKNSDVQTILPQQTVLVTSTRARSSGSAFFDTRVIFPATRVFSAWDDQRGELTRQPDKGGHPTDPILSEQGFYIELIDGKGNFSDGVGNLVKSPNRRVAATIEWELSAVSGEMMEDGRSSILRKYRDKDKKRYSDAEIEDMGVEAAGWIAAHETDFRDVRQTWYGDRDDVGSPGITGGRVLPVELSKFRPQRLESGDIVIRWITQSELNNAGFNILRSDTRAGEFTQVNTKLIAGQGTTSEKTNYEWKDTSAKPNVVYYYQIQDVSLDGQVATLAQTRLRGHISAAGKLTVTWGELKALQ